MPPFHFMCVVFVTCVWLFMAFPGADLLLRSPSDNQGESVDCSAVIIKTAGVTEQSTLVTTMTNDGKMDEQGGRHRHNGIQCKGSVLQHFWVLRRFLFLF